MAAMGQVIMLALYKISICFRHGSVLADPVESLKRKNRGKKWL